MLVASVRVGVLLACALVTGCVQIAAPPVNPTGESNATPLAAPPSEPGAIPTTAVDDGSVPLVPDDSAAYTVGDTVRLSGGEFVGDQADLTVLEAVKLTPSEAGDARFAFLVDITGLDDATFPYNALDFRLIDDQAFQYDAMNGGGNEPSLTFGDLSPNQKVRGWLTFEVSEPTTTLQLEYAPVLALEPALFGFIVP
jgi:Domain of unknown function (DUF4352)